MEVTEQEWLASADPDAMQEYLRRAVPTSDRKYRLFGCACCHRLGPLLNERNIAVLKVVERYADGLADEQEIRSARAMARENRDASRRALDAAQDSLAELVEKDICLGGAWLGDCAVLHVAGAGTSWKIALSAADSAAEAPAWVAAAAATGVLTRRADWHTDESAPWSAARKNALRIEERKQAALLQHVIGNPFSPLPSRRRYPAAVIQLAEALYQGADCSFALHDSLLDAGCPDLAAHFCDPGEWHPKGCAWLDAILDKK
jgi:hypothetical protein